jgi:hypothetical protein
MILIPPHSYELQVSEFQCFNVSMFKRIQLSMRGLTRPSCFILKNRAINETVEKM